jgi:hypothetical protein
MVLGTEYATVHVASESSVVEIVVCTVVVEHAFAGDNFALGVGGKGGAGAAYVAEITHELGAVVGGNVGTKVVQPAAAVRFVADPGLTAQSVERADRKVAVVHLPTEMMDLGEVWCADATAAHQTQIQRLPVSEFQDRTIKLDLVLIQEEAIATQRYSVGVGHAVAVEANMQNLALEVKT